MEKEKQIIEEMQKEIEKADDEFYNFCSKTECMRCKFANKFNSITECRVYFMAQELTKSYRKERQGEWLYNKGHGYYENAYFCSNCYYDTNDKTIFCPCCGRKMKGAE